MSEKTLIVFYNLLTITMYNNEKIDDSSSPQKSICYDYNIKKIDYTYIGFYFRENIIKIKLGKFSSSYYSYHITNIKLKITNIEFKKNNV